jgi:hypothetical protein
MKEYFFYYLTFGPLYISGNENESEGKIHFHINRDSPMTKDDLGMGGKKTKKQKTNKQKKNLKTS